MILHQVNLLHGIHSAQSSIAVYICRNSILNLKTLYICLCFIFTAEAGLRFEPSTQTAQHPTAVITSRQLRSSALVLFRRTIGIGGHEEWWIRFPGRLNRTQCRQRLATAAMFLRSCVAQTLSRGDGPRHSLHALA